MARTSQKLKVVRRCPTVSQLHKKTNDSRLSSFTSIQHHTFAVCSKYSRYPLQPHSIAIAIAHTHTHNTIADNNNNNNVCVCVAVAEYRRWNYRDDWVRCVCVCALCAVNIALLPFGSDEEKLLLFPQSYIVCALCTSYSYAQHKS